MWHMGRFYYNRGMSLLLGNDSVNILVATNTDKNSEYIVITYNSLLGNCVVKQGQKRFSMWSVPSLYKKPWKLFKEIRQRFVSQS
jgi:hypothetical protein